jgi:mRNA-degrading endonuclease RelE of RelBE toxin-antitoxin system
MSEGFQGIQHMSYVIDFSPAAEDHLRALTARQRATVFDTIDEHLKEQPGLETRNRKPMRPNPLAPWELRIGELRVYYDIEEGHVVEDKPEPRVLILAVGIKDRNRLMIGGEEVKL